MHGGGTTVNTARGGAEMSASIEGIRERGGKGREREGGRGGGKKGGWKREMGRRERRREGEGKRREKGEEGKKGWVEGVEDGGRGGRERE